MATLANVLGGPLAGNASNGMLNRSVAEGASNSTPPGGTGDDQEQDAAFQVLLHHTPETIMIFSGMIMLALMMGNVLHTHRAHWIPESLVVICFGAVIGIALRFLYGEHGSLATGEFTLEHEAVINEDLLTYLFLPIIIFEAGWSLRNKEFISQLPYILIFAVLGTVVCMGVVAFLLWVTSSFHCVKDVRLAFTYGALIAAVDPVATLSTYAHLNVEPLLNILVMGESIINDAVAITLFDVLNSDDFDAAAPLWKIILNIVWKSAIILGGSILLGLAGGLLLSYFVKLTGLRHSPHLAIIYVTAAAYFIYNVAAFIYKMEVKEVSVSPIITVLFAGMVMSAFVPNHLSIEGSLLCAFLLKQLSSMADMAVFSFVGIAIALTKTGGLKLGFLVMPFCLLGRAVATFPLAFLCNGIKALVADRGVETEKLNMISLRHMFMMWHAGLRGGIALVLCLSLNKQFGKEAKAHLLEATTLLICVFLLAFGGTTEMFLKLLGIPLGNPPPMILQGSCFSRALYRFQNKILRPVLKDKGQDVLMHQSVLKLIIKEAGTKDAPTRIETRHRLTREERENMHELFGTSDPLHMDGGSIPGGAGHEDPWEQYYNDQQGASSDGGSDTAASSSGVS
eukprot:CAMPEP_0204601910 /NCGR_PEP_ID=MMETSP0661-20131031/56333_1 /ASSEMBLY_ACC=CAM_ASM_000606 /TAXON_ID=109239 /ORGANISM="Alexandrium margalefi, Strain AMGDE01CS-322" /LENGTH=623 /DNA_ID=CAMNT_0051612839 /DNA_START=39 /DNA_END=1907 /DNA_ORIENTATION=-